MKITTYAFALCWALAFVLFGASVHAELKTSACVLCHEFMGAELGRPVKEWKGSIHQQNGTTCDLCHGGNPDVDVRNIKQLTGQELDEKKSQAMSVARGFIGKPAGRRLFDLCGRCHGTSVDRYAKSIMGRAYLENKGGPSCVACHHAHRNDMPDEGSESCAQGYAAFDPDGCDRINGECVIGHTDQDRPGENDRQGAAVHTRVSQGPRLLSNRVRRIRRDTCHVLHRLSRVRRTGTEGMI